MRFLMMIKGDPKPGQLPSEELLAAMGRYNEELAKAGVLLDLSGLHPSAEGARVKFAGGKRTVIDGPFTESKELVAGYWIIQAKSLDDVGSTYYLCQDQKVPITMNLGRHTNDHMVSFYLRTPSGFAVEYGWGAREVDDGIWQVQLHTSGSIWGHQGSL